MKTKENSIYLRRARQDKLDRTVYPGFYLGKNEISLLRKIKHYN